MGTDYAVLYADALAEMIRDERVLAATVTKPSMGLEPELPEPQAPSEDAKVTAGSAAIGIALTILDPPTPSLGLDKLFRALTWFFAGRAAKGGPHSIAAQLRRACGPVRLLAVVTDRRLYLLEPRDAPLLLELSPEKCRPPKEQLKALCHVERELIRSAEVRWYRLNPCRLVVHFTDGSWTAFTDLVEMGRSRARVVAAALNGRAS